MKTVKPKTPFNPDEISVVVKWACAYLDFVRPSDDAIGRDRLNAHELETLRHKLRDAAPEVILGSLNACFLLGFDVFPTVYPLEKKWRRVARQLARRGIYGTSAKQIGSFLESACLVRKQTEETKPC